MTTDIPAVMTVITLLEGMAYAPWVKVILLFGMVPVALAYCWRAVARYVMHPDSRALASMLLMGFTQIDRRLKHASRYAPEMERQRQRWAAYIHLAAHRYAVALHAFFAILALLGSLVFMLSRTRAWFTVAMLFFFLFAGLGRFELAAASRAWHSIKTGQAFT